MEVGCSQGKHGIPPRDQGFGHVGESRNGVRQGSPDGVGARASLATGVDGLQVSALAGSGRRRPSGTDVQWPQFGSGRGAAGWSFGARRGQRRQRLHDPGQRRVVVQQRAVAAGGELVRAGVAGMVAMGRVLHPPQAVDGMRLLLREGLQRAGKGRREQQQPQGGQSQPGGECQPGLAARPGPARSTSVQRENAPDAEPMPDGRGPPAAGDIAGKAVGVLRIVSPGTMGNSPELPVAPARGGFLPRSLALGGCFARAGDGVRTS